MFQYVIRRLLLMIPTFLGITFLVFFILQVAPDGPFERAVKQLKNANAQSESGVNMSSNVTGDSSELTPELLEKLRMQYQIRSVNMEDYRAAEAAQKSGVPFLSVRVVVGTASQSLPGYLAGVPRSPYKVMPNVLLMPWRIPTMLRLKKQLQLCQAVLTNFGMSYLRATGVVGNGG